MGKGLRYNNYHKHDYYGNPWSIDVIVSPEEYCKRAVELGHDRVFTVNHGIPGNMFEWMNCAKNYNLKLAYGMEAYYVPDRMSKDKSNRHLIIVARNNKGAMQLNDILTESFDTGFYSKPRVDMDLLRRLTPGNFILTTACIAGLWSDHETILTLFNMFGKNLLLEVQPHDIAEQKEANANLLDLSRNAGIKIIHANDSHYILPEDAKYREIFKTAKGITYPQEEGMILDYPDSDTILTRYEKQGILTREQAIEALENTLVFDECEELTYINDDVKLPQISEHPMEDLKAIINEGWKRERDNIPAEKRREYLDAIRYEMDIVEKTNMANYFLIDYKVAKLAQEKYNGRLTMTGRGSAPSFYITKLLGLTNIDRIAAPITLFPTRFMSVERINGSRSLPDIDLNTAEPEPFIKATKELLGEENCAWMLSWKPLQEASAFRTYCKGIGKNIKEYDAIAKNIAEYADHPVWGKVIEESKRFIGVIESVSPSPCSMLLYDKPVRRELGIVRTKSKDENEPVYCCLLDGISCDKYKYLKNDYLCVQVWGIIRDVCNLVGIPIPTIRELDGLLDKKTFEVYERGLTSTINQADSNFGTKSVMMYKPQSVSEMSAFVAILRPGCASLLEDFLNRKDYTTGVPDLDRLLEDGNHRMIYQELIMKYLIWLGVPETGSYDIIKKIAKKKFKEKELKELKSKLLEGWKNRVGTENGFEDTWTIVEQAAHYSFNACLSGDTVLMRPDYTKFDKDYPLTIEQMYRLKNEPGYAETNGYDDYAYGDAVSMFLNNDILPNRIIDIQPSGTRKIYRLKTVTDKYIDCTTNHKFPTPDGYKTLDELRVGSMVYVARWVSKNDEKPTLKAVPEKITSIKFLREDMTYDVTMDDPAHTLVSKSGVVASNSHSLAYAYDSLYGAYLKSHYPLEYYTVAFNYYADDTPRTFALTNELESFGIKVKSAKFRHSRDKYVMDKADNTIYKGIGSIKDINGAIAEKLYEMRDMRFEDFTDLLFAIKKREIPINSRQFEILINIDFFSEFGEINYLKRVKTIFDDIHKSKEISKEKLNSLCASPLFAGRFAERETSKKYVGIDSRALLKEILPSVTASPATLRERIEWQTEYLGYIDIKGEEYGGLAVVLSVNTTYSPRLSLYAMRNGAIVDCKTDKKSFAAQKLKKGDIIRVLEVDKRNKVMCDNGKFVKIPNEFDLWIKKYLLVKDNSEIILNNS